MPKRKHTPLTLEQKAINAARRKFLREQRRMAKEQQLLLPGIEEMIFFPPLKGGKNDR